MATTFERHYSQLFSLHGNQEWGDGSLSVSPWTNEDIALYGFPFSAGPFPWPYGIWSDSDSYVAIGLYPIDVVSSYSRSQIGGISMVFKSYQGQVGGAGEVYI